MRRVIQLVLLALLLGALPAGCFYVGGKAALGPDLRTFDLSPIEVGVSTRGEVLSLLGPPHEFLEPELSAALFDDDLRLDGALDVARRAEQIWTWQGETIEIDGTMLILWSGFWVDAKTNLVVVGFDDAGRVTFVTTTRREEAS